MEAGRGGVLDWLWTLLIVLVGHYQDLVSHGDRVVPYLMLPFLYTVPVDAHSSTRAVTGCG